MVAHVTAWCLLLVAVMGMSGIATAPPSRSVASAAVSATTGPDPLPARMIACWGWYESPQGWDGQECPSSVYDG